MWLLLIPPAALLLALLWTALRGRPTRAREATSTIEGYRRSMDALARPVGPSADDPHAPAVYPGDLAHERARPGGSPAGRPAEAPRAGAVVPAARVVRAAQVVADPAAPGEPAGTAEAIDGPPVPAAPGPRDGQPARPAGRRE